MAININADLTRIKNSLAWAPTKRITVNSETTLEELLMEPNIVRSFKINSQGILEFLVSHISELLQIAFRDDENASTLSAFAILSSGSHLLIPSLLQTARFGSFANKILTQNNISNVQLSRLCAVTIPILNLGNIDACKHCSFIQQLIGKCDDSNVFFLYYSIFENIEHLQKMQKYILNSGLMKYLKSILKEAFRLEEICENTKEYEKLIFIFRIVNSIVKNNRLTEEVQNSKLYKIFLNAKTNNMPFILVNHFWEIANSFYRENNSMMYCGFAIRARELLVQHTDKIRQYHYFALRIMSNYVSTRSDLIDNEMVKAVLGLFLQFPNCSFFMLEAKNFFLSASKVDILLCRIVKFVVPVLMVESDILEHGLARIFSIAILEELYRYPNAKAVMLKIDGFDECVELLKKYAILRDSEYGGGSPTTSVWSLFFYPKNFVF